MQKRYDDQYKLLKEKENMFESPDKHANQVKKFNSNKKIQIDTEMINHEYEN